MSQTECYEVTSEALEYEFPEIPLFAGDNGVYFCEEGKYYYRTYNGYRTYVYCQSRNDWARVPY